jgi:hypothetical protein
VRAPAGELLGYPAREVALPRSVVAKDLPRLCAGLREGCVALDPVAHEREDGAGRRLGEVLRDRLDVCRLPTLDLLDDDEPRAVAEQAEGVARGDGLLARALACVQDLGRLRSHALPEPADGARDLWPVAAGDQVRGLQLGRHRRQA